MMQNICKLDANVYRLDKRRVSGTGATVNKFYRVRHHHNPEAWICYELNDVDLTNSLFSEYKECFSRPPEASLDALCKDFG